MYGWRASIHDQHFSKDLSPVCCSWLGSSGNYCADRPCAWVGCSQLSHLSIADVIPVAWLSSFSVVNLDGTNWWCHVVTCHIVTFLRSGIRKTFGDEGNTGIKPMVKFSYHACGEILRRTFWCTWTIFVNRQFDIALEVAENRGKTHFCDKKTCFRKKILAT